MKTPKVVYLGILLSFLMSGCMPDSFTKFKEEPAKKKQEATAPLPDGPTLEDGSDVDFSKLDMPSGFGYSFTPSDIKTQTFIFQVGIDVSDNIFNDTGPCGMRPTLDGTFGGFFCDDPFAVETVEQAELRSTVEALDFTFDVAPNIGSPGAIGHPCPNPAGVGLPAGLDLDQSQGFIFGIPSTIASDTTAGPNYGLPYPLNITMTFTNSSLTRTTHCTTIKVASYEVPTSRDFRYQQSGTVKLELENFTGQGSMAAFSVGDFVTSNDPDGAGPLVAGVGVVIFVSEQDKEIIVQKSAGEFYIGVSIDDDASYLGPEASVKKLTNVFQTSTVANINIGPLGLPPLIASPGPYLNPTLGPENGVRFITDFDSRPTTLAFSETTGLFSGYLQTEIQEASLKIAAVNPLWQDDGFTFFDDIVNPDTGAYIGNVKYSDLDEKYNSIGIAGTQQSQGTDLATTTESFEVTDPALDGGFSDQYLLAVNDMTNFNPGDFISTNTCGTGTSDSQKMTVGRVLATVNRGFPLLDYVLVQYIRGCRFQNGDSIDNAFPYKSPKATVYEAIPNSFVIETSDAGVLAWPSKEGGSADYHISAENGAKGVINLIQNGASPAGSGDGIEAGLGASNYIFVRVTSPVDTADPDTTTVNEIDNYFSTAADANPNPWDRRRENSIRPCQVYSACATTPATINNILASTIEIEATGNLVQLLNRTGITFSNNLATAFGDIINADNTSRAVAVLNKGFLRAGQTFTDSNPYDGVTPNTATAITYVPSFYLKKGFYYEFPYTLDKGTGSSAYFIQPIAPPPGMTFNLNGNGILEGQLTENLAITTYETSASNGAGKTSFQAFFEVLEYFELTALTSAANRNTSVVLHRAGRGNQLASCGMFEAQMGIGTCTGSATNCAGGGCFDKLRCERDGGSWDLNNDILCYLEIGEEDLFYNGLKLKLEVSGAQCEFVAHKPYTLYKWRPGTTLAPNIFTHEIPAACNDTLIGSPGGNYRNKPAETISTDIDGTAGIASVRARCLYENGGFDYDGIYNTLGISTTKKGPNCDEGDVQEQKITWELEGFKCFDNANLTGTQQTYSTADECLNNIGSCSGSSTFCGGTTNADCTTKTDCESDDGLWTFTGSHNDSSKTGVQLGATGAEMNDCYRQAAVPGDLVSCAGDWGACIATSYKGTGQTTAPLSPIARREVGGVITNLITNDGAITYNYFAPDDDSNLSADYPRNEADKGNNTIIANYYGADISCIDSMYVYNATGQTLSAELGGNFNAINGGAGTNSLYTYECRNASGDMKGIIRLLVRDWNQDFQNQIGFGEIDKAFPASLIDDGLDNYPDMDSAATTNNKCLTPLNFPPFLDFGAMDAGLPIGFPNDKL